MRRLLLKAALTTLCLMVMAGAGAVSALASSGLAIAAAQTGESRHYKSPLSYEVEIPPDYVAQAMPQGKVLFYKVGLPQQGPANFYVQTCPGAVPESCIEHPEMPTRLVAMTQVKVSGRPATQYTFERQTAAGTRNWREVHTVLVVSGTAYDVVGQVAPFEQAQVWDLYRHLWQSFRLVHPPGS